MATYAILGALSFNTVTKRDAVLDKITTFLANKPTWGDKVAVASTDYGDIGNPLPQPQPSINLGIRFTQRPNLDNLFDLAKTELNKLTGVKATFSKHTCYHDEAPPRPCVIEELVTIVR